MFLKSNIYLLHVNHIPDISRDDGKLLPFSGKNEANFLHQKERSMIKKDEDIIVKYHKTYNLFG